MTTPSTDPHEVFTLQSPHFSQALVASDLDGLDRIAEAHQAEHFGELVGLIVSRAVIPVSPLVHVAILDDALTAVRIELLDGGDRGRQGWVPTSWLHASDAHAEATSRIIHAA